MVRVVSTASVHEAAPRLHLLGGMSLHASASRDMPTPESSSYEGRHHVQALLALVGASRKGIGRDELVELLWPQASTAAGRNRLYHTVHLARQVLGAASQSDEWVMVQNARVVLDERVWCDVHQLESAGERGVSGLTDAQLHELLPLCADDWMPALEIGSAGESVRARVRTTQSALLREAISRGVNRGDNLALRGWLHSLLRLQPTDEWVHRELMQLDLLAGRRHAVLRTFDKLSRELSMQLGLRPSMQTVAIAAQASAELQSQPAAKAQDTGAPTTSLVGREPLVRKLVAQMTERPGVWNFTGLSGIGKTTLARAVGRRLAPAMTDGMCVVNLGDLGAFESAASACVRALGLTSNEQGDEIELVVHAVRTRRMLLVLDDLDAASDAQALLGRLPLGKMQARVIVTTRTSVRVAGAEAVAVGRLPTPALDATPAEAIRSAAYALFKSRCPSAGPESESDAWRREAIRLVRRLDGLPLAIELAAARTVTMTPGEILAQIEHSLRPLGDGPVDLQGRHRSLQASLDWSVKLLGEVARAGYGALAVFPGEFVHADVAALMPAVGLPRAAAETVLTELSAAGLIASVDTELRLRMLHLPRAHARAHALASGCWHAVLNARLAEVCRCFDENPLVYESPHYTSSLRHVMSLEDDAVSLLDHAQAHAPLRFVQLLVALCEGWTTSGTFASVIRWAQRGIVAARESGSVSDELRLHANWVLSVRREGRFVAAEELSRALMPLCDRLEAPPLIAHAAYIRAVALLSTGRSQEGVELLRLTLARLDLRPDSPGFWTLHTCLAGLGGAMPDVQVDLPTLRVRFAGSCLWPDVLRSLFATWPSRSDFESLRGIADELLASGTALRSKRFMLDGMWRQAATLTGLDRIADALRVFGQHHRLAVDAGWYEGAALANRVMAWVHLRIGDIGSARACQTRFGELALAADSDVQGLVLTVLRAAVCVVGGEVDESIRLLRTLGPEALHTVDDEDLVEWSEVTALVANRTGNLELMAELAPAMRRLDRSDDFIPFIRRFRDLQFGPGEAAYRHRSAEEFNDLRRAIRSGLTRFYEGRPAGP